MIACRLRMAIAVLLVGQVAFGYGSASAFADARSASVAVPVSCTSGTSVAYGTIYYSNLNATHQLSIDRVDFEEADWHGINFPSVYFVVDTGPKVYQTGVFPYHWQSVPIHFANLSATFYWPQAWHTTSASNPMIVAFHVSASDNGAKVFGCDKNFYFWN